MNIGPAEIGMLLQINQQHKGKIADMEKEKIRFQTIMAEVRLNYEQKIQTLQGELQKLGLIVLYGQNGLYQSGQSNQSGLQESGDINESQNIGQSSESIGDDKERVITELKSLNEQLMRRLNEQRDHNEHHDQGIKSEKRSPFIKEDNNDQETIRKLQMRLEEQRQKSRLMEQEISHMQNVIGDLRKEQNKNKSKDSNPSTIPSTKQQNNDQYEKSDKSELQEKLNKLLIKDKQHQSELDYQIKKIAQLEESIKTLRRQKDIEITNLKKEFQDAENRYRADLKNIRQTLQSSRTNTEHDNQQINALLRREQAKCNKIQDHLQQVFENRKDRIRRGEKQNTYDDLADTLINIVKDIHNQYQATIKPKS